MCGFVRSAGSRASAAKKEGGRAVADDLKKSFIKEVHAAARSRYAVDVLRMMVYWLAAATLTACVTYTGGKA